MLTEGYSHLSKVVLLKFNLVKCPLFNACPLIALFFTNAAKKQIKCVSGHARNCYKGIEIMYKVECR